MAHIGKSYFILEPSETPLNGLKLKERNEKLKRRRQIVKETIGSRHYPTEAAAKKDKKAAERECGFPLRIAELMPFYF